MQDAGQSRLADLDGLAAQVGAVQLEQVKGVEEGVDLVPPPAKDVKGRHAPLVGAHHLAVDQARPNLEMVHRFDDKRKARRPFIGRGG